MRNPTCNLCSFGIGNAKPPKTPCLMPSVDDIPQGCDVVLVIEQPPAQDDIYGRIYSSKGLTEIRAFFEHSGIPTYCTYALKCVRPSKKVKPSTKEMKVCANEYLAKELARVNPKHIITFGSNAHYGVTHKACSLEKMGNRYFNESLQAYIYPTNHWLQGLYNQQIKDQIWANLRCFVGWIKGNSECLGFNPPVYVADTLQALRSLQKRIDADARRVIAVDVETQGLNPYCPGKQVRSIQFCWDTDFGGVFVPLGLESDCYYTDTNDVGSFWQEESLEEAVGIIREILADNQCVWHNGKFDRLWLYKWGEREFGKPIEAPHIYMDTLHVAHNLDENRILKLKKLITSELGYPTYDISDKLTKDLDVLIPYAAKDTVATLLLAQKYSKALQTVDLEKIRKLYVNVTRPMDTIFTEMELQGWPVDRETCLELHKLVVSDLKKVEADLHDILREYDIEVSSKAFASPKQLIEIIFKRLKYPVNPDRRLALTKTGSLSTGSDALLHLRHKPFISKLLEWRGHAKMLSTYVEPMLRAAETRGRITTSYKLTGTVTGRTASGKEKEKKRASTAAKDGSMNLQNLPYTRYGPRKIGVKNCIRARDGWSILEADFSQIELRIAGELSGDSLLNRAYREGKDIHAIRAMRIMGITPEDWAKLSPEDRDDKRTKAKAANFGFIYGMQAAKYKTYALTDYNLDLSMMECSKTRAGFFADHTGLEPWYGQQERTAKKYGYVESLSGRRRHLPNIRLDPESGGEAKRKYAEAVRMAINTPVQGFASDLKLMSIIEIRSWLNPDDAYLFGEVHDSILLEVRNEVLEDVARKILKTMSHPHLLDKLGITLAIPICAEIKAGPSLGEAKELKLAA
jgi:uracil-DNA glycosylase family 4